MFVNFKNVENLKTLDDIVTIDGKKVKPNSFLRGGALNKISNEELEILKSKYKLKKVIDFRSDKSFINKKDLLDDSIEYVHIRALEYLNYTPYDKNIPLPPIEFFLDLYKRLAVSEDGIECFKKFFQEILSCDGGSILYHCTSGKDRTGVATSLLLYVLGCSMDTIYDEYLSVNSYQKNQFDNFLKTYTPVDKDDYIFYETYYIAKREFLKSFFDSIILKYGSVRSYLINALCLSEYDIMKIRNKYLC